MHLKDLLNKEQIKININKADEYILVKNNLIKYNKTMKQFHLTDKVTPFSLIVRSIILKALINKAFIEKELKKLVNMNIERSNKNEKEGISKEIIKKIKENDLPYLMHDKKEIYVPLFSLAINNIYSLEPYRLFENTNQNLFNNFYPYLIDMFELYNISLYDSNFTKLIKIKEYDDGAAFYHKDFKTIYFINRQGRLDYELNLFDKYLKDIDLNNLNIRLNNVVDAYLNSNLNSFIESLLENKFISEKLVSIYNDKKKKI